ncbi:MAG: helix-turn-helix domain-containing protein [Acidiferrobacterales bacterium]|nr:helix-turn-helix domain-containing protein [Acidiferrobacterales bacterium]
MEKDQDQRISFDTIIPEPSEPLIVAAADTGEQLAAAREQKGLSVQNIAEALKLTEGIITAVENQDYDQLYGAAYATGYVRSYAKLVDLDPDELIANDPKLGISEIQIDRSNTTLPTPLTAKLSNIRWAAIFLRLAIVASAIVVSFAIWKNWDLINNLWEPLVVEQSSTEESVPTPQSESRPDDES